MTAHVIDGKAIAARRLAALKEKISRLPFRPGLVVVLLGDEPASAVYVRSKDRGANQVGIVSRTVHLPAHTSQAHLLTEIHHLNTDPGVDGILVQRPWPPQIEIQAVLEAIDPAKDVDGFHPLNVGRLADGHPYLVPCTPLGVMRLLEESGVKLVGTRAVVIGRSTIVGRPVAQLLVAADATVTIVHSRTRDLPAECRRAEILIAAAGRPGLVRGGWVEPGVTIIDVGINRVDGRLAGDVMFAECVAVARAITPVPGGVGPMTIACLLENTVTAAIQRRTAVQKSVQRPFTSQSP